MLKCAGNFYRRSHFAAPNENAAEGVGPTDQLEAMEARRLKDDNLHSEECNREPAECPTQLCPGRVPG
eukprot:12086296-Alexandrium_andersonii.AAC.1